ncbi:hypothetical protein ANO11243_049290 [Dothideomycetidae sp. 11243]|nr:hypothetical protein ANO11243_049290 [fungal sp. No.11243]
MSQKFPGALCFPTLCSDVTARGKPQKPKNRNRDFSSSIGRDKHKATHLVSLTFSLLPSRRISLVPSPPVAMQSSSNVGAQPYSSMAGKLDAHLLRAVAVMGFDTMTPVQHRVLTELPSWSSDCLVQAKTGTGKTLAFLLPALHCLLNNFSRRPRGHVAILTITPTRELAQQIKKQCDQLTSQLATPLECHIAVGGTGRGPNLNRFMNGNPSILVATPGRLKDYLSETQVAERFHNIQTLVLDEADTMLEAGFLQDVRGILASIPPKRNGWQGMCFSATIPPKVKDVVNVVLQTGYISISTIEQNETPTVDRVPQFLVVMPTATDTFNVLAALLQYEMQSSSKIIVFGVTANMVALYAKVFSQNMLHLNVFEIHSRLSQNARTRTTNEFKEAKAGVMFASDVVGRGMDFPNVDLVVQVGLPSSGEQYVHRVGRTARAGAEGRAVILLAQSETFFTLRNPHLPIKPHPEAEKINQFATECAPTITEAMYNIDEVTKQRAYSSFIGFFAGSGLMKALRIDKADLVALANDLAIRGMACPEPPPMDKKVVGKMGLKGVPGFNYGSWVPDMPRQHRQAGGGGGPRVNHAGKPKLSEGPGSDMDRSRRPRPDGAQDVDSGRCLGWYVRRERPEQT